MKQGLLFSCFTFLEIRIEKFLLNADFIFVSAEQRTCAVSIVRLIPDTQPNASYIPWSECVADSSSVYHTRNATTLKNISVPGNRTTPCGSNMSIV
jgi:hypothetical protein